MYGAEKITREYILSRVSEEEIFSYYLGIPVQFRKYVVSPLRADKSPTCGFTIDRRGVLKFKDFAGHFHGDCFNVVEFIHHVSFSRALDIIAQDFGLKDKPVNPILIEQTRSGSVREPKAPTRLEVRRQHWTATDKSYWSSFGIKSSTLRYYNVSSLENAWVNGSMVYAYRESDPGYVFSYEPGVYKFYFPLRTDNRFLTNSGDVVQGYKQLPATGEVLVLTKSLKDVMLLYQYGIAAVALPSETSSISEDLVWELSCRFETIVVLYDYDYAGVKGANRLRKRYQFATAFLTPRFGAKDISDFYKTHGEQATASLLFNSLLWLKQLKNSL